MSRTDFNALVPRASGELEPEQENDLLAEKKERMEALRRADMEIRGKAQSIMRAVLSFGGEEGMSEKELAIAEAAMLCDREVPYAIKAATKLTETYAKLGAEQTHGAPLAVQVNMYAGREDIEAEFTEKVIDVD